MADVNEEISRGPLSELARAPAPPYRWLRAAGWGFARIFSILALAVAWEVAARSGAFTPYMLPALSAVLERIWNDLLGGELLLNTGVTLYRAMTGFVIGAVAYGTMPVGRVPISFDLRAFILVGICGGYTTFSSFSLQTLTLLQEGEWFRAAANAIASFALCLAAVWLGHFLVSIFNKP